MSGMWVSLASSSSSSDPIMLFWRALPTSLRTAER
jgi:hypothetical protein